MTIAWRKAVVVTLTSMVGCHLVGGVSDLEYRGEGTGGAGATSSGSSTGGGSTGGGGDGLSGPCQPGESTDCYTGPNDTLDVGQCTAGVAECTDGEWGPCEGEVLPQPEICDNGVDESCDGADAPLTTGCLGDEGLVARYFIDEDTSGPATGQIFDSGPNSEHLQVFPVMGKPEWFLNPQGTGLFWSSASIGGRVSKQVGFDSQSQLQGSTTATVELVVQVATSNSAGLFIAGLWAGPYELSLWSDELFSVYVVAGNGEAGRWSHPTPDGNDPILWGPSSPPRVLHAVYDSTATDPGERLVLYVDGVAGDVVNAPSVTMGEAFDFPSTPHITFGNVPTQDPMTAMAGKVYYMAIYDVAMAESQVADHVAIFQQSNDGPPR